MHQIGLWRFHDQMVVIAHQHPGMNLPPRLLTSLAEAAHEEAAIDVIAKDWLAPIPTRQHVVEGTRKIRTEGCAASHQGSRNPAACQDMLTDPYAYVLIPSLVGVFCQMKLTLSRAA